MENDNKDTDIKVNVSESQQERIQKLNNINNSFFKKVDEKSGVFYLVIALVCFIIFVATMVYSFSKLDFDEKTNVYMTKSGNKIYEFRLERSTPYFNNFLTDSEDIIIKKENDLSSLVYTDYISYEETDNFKINASLPKLNISPELKIKEFEKIKDKIIDINDRITTIRTVFEGDNQLNFDYYATYYQNTLSFGYSYYESFNNVIVSDTNSLVFNAEKNKMMSFNEYLKSRSVSESKISEAIREIIRREKLKHKYNKRTKFFYIEPNGSINLIIDGDSRINITVK